jgi:hypothetical protein
MPSARWDTATNEVPVINHPADPLGAAATVLVIGGRGGFDAFAATNRFCGTTDGRGSSFSVTILTTAGSSEIAAGFIAGPVCSVKSIAYARDSTIESQFKSGSRRKLGRAMDTERVDDATPVTG